MADGIKRETIINGTVGGTNRQVQVRRVRPNAFTQAKQAIFMERLAESANITLSAEAAGVSVETIRRWRRRVPAFAAAWQRALAEGYADLEARTLAQLRFGVTSERETSVTAEGALRTVERRDAPGAAVRLLQMHRAEATAIRAVQQSGAAALSPQEHARLVAKVRVAIDLIEGRRAEMPGGRGGAAPELLAPTGRDDDAR